MISTTPTSNNGTRDSDSETEHEDNGHDVTAKAADRLRAALRKGGVYYTALYTTRWLLQNFLDWMDRRLVRVEQRRCLTESWSIMSRRFTAADNKHVWNTYDWSKLGEEWTRSDSWKEQVIREWVNPYFPVGGSFVEIGPGGGRWSEVLRQRAGRLLLVDVAEAPISICRQRFQDCSNIDYFVGDGKTINAESASVDAVWSYECFVHITPLDIKGYLRELKRILRPGGHALLHHAGPPLPGQVDRRGWRSDMTDRLMRVFAEELGLEIVEQTRKLVNPGDVLTILRQPSN
jgi:ubiquinone/menaquinone biosynthesis C-methylase UbiE